MANPSSVRKAHVFRNGERVGILERSVEGSVFRYEPSVIGRKGGVAFNLPFAHAQFETKGVNLHPFFANLLPEGIRLRALVRKAKTSADDLFSLLISTSTDTVGDVHVAPIGKPAPRRTIELEQLDGIDFVDLRKELLAGKVLDENIPGVQPKISASRVLTGLRSTRKGVSYILKLPDPELPLLIENEHACMELAALCAIPAAKTQIVQDKNGVTALLVERFDRQANGSAIHFEDLCQLTNRYPSDKYEITVEEGLEAIAQTCTATKASCLAFLRLYAFSYAIGNGDMHAKNFGVLGAPDSDFVTPAPAYDLVSTLAFEGFDQKRSMPFEGKRGNLYRKDLLEMARLANVSQRAVESMLDALIQSLLPALDGFDSIGLNSSLAGRIKVETIRRIRRLAKE